MDWAYLLAYLTGMVNKELLLRNEYLATENRTLKAQIKSRVPLSDAKRITLAEIGQLRDSYIIDYYTNAVPGGAEMDHFFT